MRLILCCCVALGFSQASFADVASNFQLPKGFEISLYADDDLAHDVFSMTIDSKGRVVVAGRGYVKILHDDNGDGKADRATLFSDWPKSGARGMVFDGDDLICTGDNGVWRIPDRDGDGVADGPGQRWTELRHPEHGANGIVRGPDGWYYLICGNDAGVSEKNVTLPGSPVKEPLCGALIRFSPDGKNSEVYADGFRNPYDLAINADGRIFTVDSDGERDHHLPWYSGTRLFDIAQGMRHGWLLRGWQRSWNRPEWFYDNVDRIADFGRGSPTGVEVYAHTRFPERYRSGVFSCCWTFGRVYYIPMSPSQSSYSGETETFLQTTGAIGFAPVDLAVGPEGDLFVAIGGRGTRGGVFRVRYVGDEPIEENEASNEPLDKVLSAPQPLSSWSRAKWVPLARELGKDAFLKAMLDRERSIPQRIRAVETLTELFEGPPLAAAKEIAKRDDPQLVARAIWGLSRSGQGRKAREFLAERTHDFDGWVRREAWEAIAALPELPEPLTLDWRQATLSLDRRLRWAMILASRGSARDSFRLHAENTFQEHPMERTPTGQALLWIEGPPDDAEAMRDYVDACLAYFVRAGGVLKKLESVRLLQIGLGDIRLDQDGPEAYPGYVALSPENIDERTSRIITGVLAMEFPHADPLMNRELARTFSMLESRHSKLIPALASLWTESSLPQDDVHYLIVASRLPGPREAATTEKTAEMLIRLYTKMNRRQLHPSRNFGSRVNEALDALMERDERLAAALVTHDDFGRSDHVHFLPTLDGDLRLQAIRKLISYAQAGEGEESDWTAELVATAAELPADEALPTLRQHLDWPGFRDVALAGIASFADPQDKDALVAGLNAVDPQTVLVVAQALKSIDGKATADEIATAISALRRFCEHAEQSACRNALDKLLAHWTGAEIAVADVKSEPMRLYDAWLAWLEETHPAHADRLKDARTPAVSEWLKRLEKVDWTAGNATRGQEVFESKACNRCHIGARRLGPSLSQVTQRLSREDLFAKIVDPSRSISPLYQTTLVATEDGMVYHGIMIYESPEGTLLQTGPDTTVRLLGEDVVDRRTGTQSLMPNGLLDELTDRQLADLHAYLETIAE